ncbi:MAG: thioredoxin TrxC [Planktotalea sp.]|uniref:thioredoxin TrxC n=1 Tax=Planktotalea sp. TaxID=2029877 RepID=UPI003C749D72
MAGKKLTCLKCAQVNRVPFDKLGDGPKCGSCAAPLMPSKAVEITPAILTKASATDDVPLVVDFWAPWCGPCKMMGPEFDKAAGQLAGKARLVKVNTQTHQSVSGKLGIRGIPTMIAWQNGRELKRQSGAMKVGQIVGWVPRG